ncbi:MAG: hypothetical protein ACRBCT_01175 [Alphaproteobacteria bacterium]
MVALAPLGENTSLTAMFGGKAGVGADAEYIAQALAAKAAYEKLQDHDGQLSESRVGVIASGAAAGQAQSAKVAEENEKAAKERFDTAVLLALLDDIQFEINKIEEEIVKIDQEIDAVQELALILEGGGIIDPTNSEHQRLLRQADIPVDDWGIVDEQYLSDLEADKTDERSELERNKEALVEMHDQMQVKIENGTFTAEDEVAFIEKGSDLGIDSFVAFRSGQTDLASDTYSHALDGVQQDVSMSLNSF